jgi:hypothetical protein
MPDLITISVRDDFLRLRDTLDDFARRQLPFALARALTETARQTAAEMTRALPSIFDRPTPFTLRAMAIKPARKENLEAWVFIKDIQARYLKLEETGGAREPEPGSPLVVPVDATLNQYGNIPRGALSRLKGTKRGQVFVGTIKGVTGFWQRGPFHSIRLLAALHREEQYRPRFRYAERVRASVERIFPAELSKQLERALATAKK